MSGTEQVFHSSMVDPWQAGKKHSRVFTFVTWASLMNVLKAGLFFFC